MLLLGYPDQNCNIIDSSIAYRSHQKYEISLSPSKLRWTWNNRVVGEHVIRVALGCANNANINSELTFLVNW
jgi:hypothetical protein